MDTKIWLAIVKVSPLKGNEFLASVKAYVNVACIAADEEQFVGKLHSYFKLHKFEIHEIDDVLTESSLGFAYEKTEERINLINEINEGYEFAWGTFHVFEGEDDD